MDSGYSRIFAAIDGGESQREVVQKAIALAARNHAALCLGHVVDAPVSDASVSDTEKLVASARELIEQDLADLLEGARNNEDIVSVELKVVPGSVTETLGNTVIPSFDPDLVICCKRGLSSFRYAFVGSVSTYLVRNMSCDVLVVSRP